MIVRIIEFSRSVFSRLFILLVTATLFGMLGAFNMTLAAPPYPVLDIGAVEIQFVQKDPDTGVLYVGTDGRGLVTIDTQGNTDVSDDVVLGSYNRLSDVAIDTNIVIFAEKDSSTGYLYLSSGWGGGGGISIIDTQNTKQLTDDIVVASYNQDTSPRLSDNSIVSVDWDSSNGLIWGGSRNGLNLIDTSSGSSYVYKTDGVYDTTAGLPGTLINPSVTTQSNWVSGTYFDTSSDILYIGDAWGMTVVDTNGTYDPTDDTEVKTYNSGSTPSVGYGIPYEWLQRGLLKDESNNLMYLSAQNGGYGCLSRVDLSTDTAVAYRYNGVFDTTNGYPGTLLSSNPRLSANPVRHTWLDEINELLFVSHYNSAYAVTVIDTQGTVDASDDTINARYGTSSTPAIGENWSNYAYLDHDSGLLYIGTQYSGMYIVDTQGTKDSSDDETVGGYSYDPEISITGSPYYLQQSSYAAPALPLDGSQAKSAAAGDFNGDGYGDFAVGQYNYSSGKGLVNLYKGGSTGLPAKSSNRIIGEGSGDWFGYTNIVGDLNNDGIDDLIVTGVYAPSASTGQVYVYWGRSDFFETIDSFDDADIVVVAEQTYSRFGGTDSNAIGDINNDGWPDLVIGAYRYNPGGQSNAGRTYVLFGGETAWDADRDATNADIKITGATANYHSGQSHLVRDINKDGIDDIFISSWRNDLGTTGEVDVFFGRETWDSSYSIEDYDVRFSGSGGASYLGGHQNFDIYDMDKDGYMDVVMGASSQVHVFWGSSLTWSGYYDVVDSGLVIESIGISNAFGRHIEVGDFNNDGFGDILAGDYVYGQYASSVNNDTLGAVYTFWGSPEWKDGGYLDAAEAASSVIVPVGYRTRNTYSGYDIAINDIDADSLSEAIFVGSQGGTGRVDSWEFGNDAGSISLTNPQSVYNAYPEFNGSADNPVYNNLVEKTQTILDIGENDFTGSSQGDWDGRHTVYTPAILKQGNTYKMWYGGNGEFGRYWSGGYATSSDGVNWSKYDDPAVQGCGFSEDYDAGCVISRGAGGMWDDAHLIPTSVIYDEDESIYKMWYMGHNGSRWIGIGYATSTDGISWSKYDDPAVAACGFGESSDDGCVMARGSNGFFDDIHIGYARVKKEESSYKMWYSGHDGSHWAGIGYATSPDGINWTKYDDPVTAACGFGESTDDGCIIGLGSGFDSNGILTGGIVEDSGTYYMCYSGHNTLSWQIGCAESSDGISWAKYNESAASLDLPNHFSVDKAHIYLGDMIKEGDTFRIWYSAHDGYNVRAASAQSADLLSFTRIQTTEDLSTNNTITTVEYRIDGGEWKNCLATDGTFDQNTDNYECSVTEALAEGTHTYEARYMESNGVYIVPAKYVQHEFTVDTTVDVPIIESIGLIEDVPNEDYLYYYFTDDTPHIEGTGEPGATVYFQVSDDESGSSIVYSAQVGSDGTWIIELDQPLSSGSTDIVYFQEDAVGNISSERVLVLVTGEENFPEWVIELIKSPQGISAQNEVQDEIQEEMEEQEQQDPDSDGYVPSADDVDESSGDEEDGADQGDDSQADEQSEAEQKATKLGSILPICLGLILLLVIILLFVYLKRKKDKDNSDDQRQI